MGYADESQGIASMAVKSTMTGRIRGVRLSRQSSIAGSLPMPLRFGVCTVILFTADWLPVLADPPTRSTLEQLEKRAANLIPSREQLRYQEIPWVHDLAEAQDIARAERRPIFLWGYGGRARPDNGLEGC
jgi:hypothetical protein